MEIVLGKDNKLTECIHWQAGDGIWAIQCPGFLPGPGRLPGWGYVISYLITGSDKALLLDTGFGISDLKAYAEQLTRLPLIVVNSHVHPDHSGGNPQFGTVLIGEHEWDSTEGFVFPPQAVPGKVCEAVARAGSYRFAYLKDGEKIDLGGRTLQVVEIPGHTKGSIALFDSKTHVLFSGDAILKRVFYGAGVPFSSYKAGLEKAKKLPISEILSAHWPEPLPVSYIDRMLSLLAAFDPEQSEPAAWDVPDAPPLRMFCRGRDFDDPEFCAVSFSMQQLDQICR